MSLDEATARKVGERRGQPVVLTVNSGAMHKACLLYTSDAADERSSVDLGGRRIIKNKKHTGDGGACTTKQTNHKSTTEDNKW